MSNNKTTMYGFEATNRVKRKKGDDIKGTIVSVENDRCKIKWDVKANTGQQHSTIHEKFLEKVED